MSPEGISTWISRLKKIAPTNPVRAQIEQKVRGRASLLSLLEMGQPFPSAHVHR